MEVYSTVPADAISELDVRFAAIAAEIASDARPEPEPPAGGAAVKRSKYDGLTGPSGAPGSGTSPSRKRRRGSWFRRWGTGRI